MCGIAGFSGEFDEALLARMNAAMAHRGPDDEHVHLEPGLALGVRRLSVIDVDGANLAQLTTRALRRTRGRIGFVHQDFALVPNTVSCSSCAIFHRTRPSSQNGAPSYSSSVASAASPLTSQFHIIQPQVVK